MAPAPPDAPDALVIAQMRRRVRVMRALRALVEYAVWGLALATLSLLGARAGVLPASRARVALLCAAALPLAGALVAAARRVSALAAAQLLDRHYDLHDRLSSALEFRALPAAERTPWMAAAIDDAAAQVSARGVDPARALAWRWPDEIRVVVGLAAALALVGVAEFRVQRIIEARAPAAAPRDPLALDDDDLRAFRDLSRELARDAATPAARDTLRDFDRFLDDVAARRLDRHEAFRRLAALQQTLDAGVREDRDALRETLGAMGERMGDRSAEARDLSQALRQGDMQAARAAMERLSQQVRQERALAAQQRQELARALQRAGEARNDPELQRRLEQARRDVDEMLRRQREGAPTQGEQDLLHRRQREAQTLERQRDRNEQTRRQVEHLQRELAEAARNLPRDPSAAGQNLAQGAEQLSRMEDEQRAQQSLEELRQRLEELRDQMRQQNGQNGQRQRQRITQFARAAAGRSGQQGQRGQGQQGQQGQGQSSQGQQGQQGQGQQGQGQQGQGQQGQSGANGQQGSSQGQGQQGQSGANGPAGGAAGMQQGSSGAPTMAVVQQGVAAGREHGEPSPGTGAGAQHDENLRGAAAQTAQASQAVQVHGQQTGNGPSRSQVIRTAASDGFASAPYRQVYAPYWDHAREVLHQAEVPAGYRSYVRRYFQLIRPRDEQ